MIALAKDRQSDGPDNSPEHPVRGPSDGRRTHEIDPRRRQDRDRLGTFHAEGASKLPRSGPPRGPAEPRGHQMRLAGRDRWTCRACGFLAVTLQAVAVHVATSQHSVGRIP